MKNKLREIGACAFAGLALMMGTANPATAGDAAEAAASEAPAPTFGDYQAKGFLSDYSRLAPMEGEKDAYFFETSEIDKARNGGRTDRLGTVSSRSRSIQQA